MALGTHVQLLAAELRRFGFTKPAAATLSSEVVLRHPIVHRVGVKKLTRRFMRHGLATEDATHLALSLWGLERFQLGARFQDLRNTLRRAGVEDSDALAACLEAVACCETPRQACRATKRTSSSPAGASCCWRHCC